MSDLLIGKGMQKPVGNNQKVVTEKGFLSLIFGLEQVHRQSQAQDRLCFPNGP